MQIISFLAPLALASLAAAASNSTGNATVTEVVTSFTTYCPESTTLTYNNKTYTITSATTLTITDCPCTLTHTTPASEVPTIPAFEAPIPVPGVPTTLTPVPVPSVPVIVPSVLSAPVTIPISYANTTVPATGPAPSKLSPSSIGNPAASATTSNPVVTAGASRVGSGAAALGLVAGAVGLLL